MSDADLQRAQHASELLRAPLMQESFAALSTHYLTAIRTCDAKDDMGRYRYTVALNVVEAVQRHLRAIAESGALDEAQAREFNTPRRWVPRF